MTSVCELVPLWVPLCRSLLAFPTQGPAELCSLWAGAVGLACAWAVRMGWMVRVQVP